MATIHPRFPFCLPRMAPLYTREPPSPTEQEILAEYSDLPAPLAARGAANYQRNLEDSAARTVQNHPRLEQCCRAGAAPHPSHHGSPENTRYGNPRDRGAPAPDHDRPHRRPRRAIRRGRRRRRGPRAGGPDPTHGAMVTADG